MCGVTGSPDPSCREVTAHAIAAARIVDVAVRFLRRGEPFENGGLEVAVSRRQHQSEGFPIGDDRGSRTGRAGEEIYAPPAKPRAEAHIAAVSEVHHPAHTSRNRLARALPMIAATGSNG
jgi:hypothetical protein